VGVGDVEVEAWCVFGHPLIDRMILPSDVRCSTCNGDLPTILRAAELRRKARATRRAAAAARRRKSPTRTYCEGCGDYHTDSEDEEDEETEEEESNGEDDVNVVEEAWEEG
jgi:hypothetical protein